MSQASNTPSGFLRTWLRCIAALGGVALVLGLLGAPMLLPVLLGDTWWVFVLMGFALFFVVSFVVTVLEWL